MATAAGVRRTAQVWTLPNVISMVRLLGVPLFLWLASSARRPTCWALVVLMLSGFTDWLDGYLARRLDQTSKLGEILDPVADRLYILAVVIGLLYRDIIPWWVAIILPLRDAAAVVPGAVPAHPRLLRAAGALPRQGGHRRPALRLPAAVPRRRRRGRRDRWPEVFGWAFAIWGIGLYWWAGLLYAWQVRKLMADRERRAPTLRGRLSA